MEKTIKKIFPGYKVKRKLGEGGFAHVFLTTKKKKSYVIKLIDITKSQVKELTKNEIAVMRYLGNQQDYFPKLYDTAFNKEYSALLMEYIPGMDLFDFVMNHHLTEVEWIPVFLKICYAVFYLHLNEIAHNDLKLENIMIQENRDIRIIDFGLASTLHQDLQDHFGIHRNARFGMGNSSTIAPERLMPDTVSIDLQKSDLFSLGCIFYAVLCDRYPYGNDSFYLLNIDYQPPELYGYKLNDIIMKMIQRDYRARPEWIEIISTLKNN